MMKIAIGVHTVDIGKSSLPMAMQVLNSLAPSLDPYLVRSRHKLVAFRVYSRTASHDPSE